MNLPKAVYALSIQTTKISNAVMYTINYAVRSTTSPPAFIHVFLHSYRWSPFFFSSPSIPLAAIKLPKPLTRTLRLILRQRHILLHLRPINPIPPLLQKVHLAADAVVVKPDVLPRVHAQQGRDVDTAERLLGLVLVVALLPRVCAEGAGVRFRVVGVQVDALLAVVGAAEGAAGDVGGEDLEGCVGDVVCLDEPDEAGAEHGVCGEEEGFLEGLEGREVAIDEGRDVGGGIGVDVGVGVDAAEEEVVVESHGGDVESVGHHGVAGDIDDEGLGVSVLVCGTWSMSVRKQLLSCWATGGCRRA